MFNYQQNWKMVGVYGSSSDDKNMIINTEVQNRSSVIWISRYIQQY